MPMVRQVKEARLGLTSSQPDSKAHYRMHYTVAEDNLLILILMPPHIPSPLSSYMSSYCPKHAMFSAIYSFPRVISRFWDPLHFLSSGSHCSPVSPKCLLSLVTSNKAFPLHWRLVTFPLFSALLLLPATNCMLPEGRNCMPRVFVFFGPL